MTIPGTGLDLLDFDAIRAASGSLWPYLVVVFAGFLPSEVWRWSGVFISRGLSDQDEIIIWVKCVSSALLTGVVAKLLLYPSGALAAVPLALRIVSLAAGMGASLMFRRSVMIALLVGESVLMTGAWLIGRF